MGMLDKIKIAKGKVDKVTAAFDHRVQERHKKALARAKREEAMLKKQVSIAQKKVKLEKLRGGNGGGGFGPLKPF